MVVVAVVLSQTPFQVWKKIVVGGPWCLCVCRIKWLSRHDKVEELGGNRGHGQNGLSGDLSIKGCRISF